GTHGINHLLKTLHKQGACLAKPLITYQTQLTTCLTNFPGQTYPPSLSYKELFTLEANHPFWNDGLFTNSGEPWAVDPNTCHGM
ncbi:hypothetical protein CROQUDRAFT_52297, partial [Cronartium quercuum f. sp. fusiforme G11]